MLQAIRCFEDYDQSIGGPFGQEFENRSLAALEHIQQVTGNRGDTRRAVEVPLEELDSQVTDVMHRPQFVGQLGRVGKRAVDAGGLHAADQVATGRHGLGGPGHGQVNHTRAQAILCEPVPEPCAMDGRAVDEFSLETAVQPALERKDPVLAG